MYSHYVWREGGIVGLTCLSCTMTIQYYSSNLQGEKKKSQKIEVSLGRKQGKTKHVETGSKRDMLPCIFYICSSFLMSFGKNLEPI